MKIQFAYLVFLLSFSSIVSSQIYHDTQGKLEISDSGQATYTLPIAMPPSIQDVGPTINLIYSSGQQGGVAGQGWNISGLSSIARISTRKDIDGFIDGVDFDNNDKLSFDGQRLLLKSGTYWGDGSTYETEIQSNLKIELTGSGVNTLITVTNTDGSKSWYGNPGIGSGVIGNEFDDFFYIKKYQDVNGNVIEYKYVAYGIAGFIPKLYIDQIWFSANTISNPTYLNKIKFNYLPAARNESTYIKGVDWKKSYILNNIEVYTNNPTNNLFRKYQLFHQTDELGYQRVVKIQESNGYGELANPVDIEYHSTSTDISINPVDGMQGYGWDPSGKIPGDIDGDGKPEFVFENKITRGSYSQPAILPFNSDTRKTHFIKTIQDNKLVQKSTLLNIVENLGSLDFNLYSVPSLYNTSPVFNNYSSKTIAFNNVINYDSSLNTVINTTGLCSSNCGDNCENVPPTKRNEYLQGDFNGDGISEMLILSKVNEKYYLETTKYILPMYFTTSCNIKTIGDSVEAYLIDLNPNVPAILGSAGYAKLDNLNYLQNTCKKYIQDFNGDGKDDILVVNQDNSYKVISINQLAVAPWVTAEIIGQGTFYYSFYADRPLYFGDFNGDGKVDMLHPYQTGNGCEDDQGCDLWYVYYSNPKLNNGSFFEIIEQYITPYMPKRDYEDESYYNQYIVLDTNKDGISDLVRVELRTYEDTDFWDMNHMDDDRNSFRIHNFAKTPTGFVNNYTTPFYEDNIVNNNVASIVNTNVNRLYLNQDLVLYRPGNWLNGTDTVFYINFTDNFVSDNCIKKITQSGGAIVDEIEYKKLGQNADAPNFYKVNDVPLSYPYVDVKELPNVKLVSKIKNTVGNNVKVQEFAYLGYTINTSTIGSLGFKKTARTSWFPEYGSIKIWSITENDISKRNAIYRNCTRLYNSTDVLNMTTCFIVSNGLISSSINTYFPEVIDPLTKRYVLLLKDQSKTDYLTNVSNVVTYGYSSDGYYLPSSVISKNYLLGVLQGTTTTTTNFENNLGFGSDYYIGRPKEIYTTVAAYGDTKTAYEKLSYFGGNVTVKEKKVGTTVASIATATEKIIETMSYFPNGNLQSKTLSASGFPATTPALGTRVTNFTYDSSNRFVKTTTNADGIINTVDSYHNLYGVPLSETNNTLSQTTTSVYDNWGKRTKVTDFLGKYIDYVYTKSNNIYITTQNGQDGSSSFIESDVLGRTIRKGVKNINNVWSYTSIDYDSYGRKYLESDPYFASETPVWNSVSYDEYDRPMVTTSKGKRTTITYNGVQATSADGLTTKTTTKNANGHLLINYDSLAGSISYTYDALGNILSTNYDGVVNSTVQYDLWGRKISFNDVSAGLYTYEYNAFGDLLKESTPKGFTDYTYTSSGKILTKWIKDANPPVNTDIKSTYNYDTTYKWLNDISVLNPIDGNSSFVYTYDVGSSSGYTNTKQLKKVVENTPQATFTKDYTFDGFGRVLTETLIATAHSKTATKTTYNTYVNGQLYQKFDGTAAVGTPIWKANVENARGQLTSVALGNGINITNSYSNYGYFTSSIHSNAQTNITLSNTYDATPIVITPPDMFGMGGTYTTPTGNLIGKTNSITSNGNVFELNEDYTYDNLDRLTLSKSNDLTLLFDSTFISSDEGFVAYNSSIPAPNLGSGTATQILNNGKLEVTVTGTAGTRKILFQNVLQGKMFKIQADINFIYGNGSCLFGGSPQAQMAIKEIDPNTQQELLSTTLTGTNEYTVVNSNTNIVLQIGSSSFLCSDYVIFTLDNVKVLERKVATQDYDNRGRITQNDLGNYNYTNGAKPYLNTSVTLSTEGLTYYNTRPSQTVSYNAFNAPINIYESGKDRLSFGYSAMQQRSVMYYGSVNTNKMLRPYRKYYSSDGSMEIKYTLANGTVPEKVEFFTYIGGDAYSAPIVSKQENSSTPSYYYLHRDYQGTILAITNNLGAVIEKRQFDVWGNILKVQDGSGNVLTKLAFFDRGYTGHEHLQDAGLINMNARLYDPKIHRFLQPDKFIKDTSNGQNYNRYAYCLNNPTRYVDPDGNNPIVIGVVVALASYFVTSAINHQNVTFGGILKAAFVGCASSALSFGVGEATQTITILVLKAAVQAVAHGVTQGAVSYVQGGKFWSSFTAGCISSIASSGFVALPVIGKSEAGMLTFATISGGAGAALTGGNFWQGAVTALVVSGLNHYYHMQEEKWLINNNADEYLRQAGYDPYGDIKANGEEELKSYVFDMRIRVLPLEILYDASGAILEVNLNLTKYGQYLNGVVTIGNRGFQNNHELFLNMMHEGLHAWDDSQGLYKAWGDDNYRAITETRAYEIMHWFDNNVFDNKDHNMYYKLYSNQASKTSFNNYRIKSYSIFFTNIQK